MPRPPPQAAAVKAKRPLSGNDSRPHTRVVSSVQARLFEATLTILGAVGGEERAGAGLRTAVTTGAWPSVGVVVPTRQRPEQLRKAVSAILAQDYPKSLEVVVVYDGVPVDGSLSGQAVRSVRNARKAGLPGARNTGILALDTDLVAFCDDDDEWLPGKLRTQVEALAASHADFATSSVMVAYDGTESIRSAGTDLVTHERLVRSRMSMLHSSTFVVRRLFLNEIGLVDESIQAVRGRIGTCSSAPRRSGRSSTLTPRLSASPGVALRTSPATGKRRLPRSGGCSSAIRRSVRIGQRPLASSARSRSRTPPGATRSRPSDGVCAGSEGDRSSLGPTLRSPLQAD